MNYYAPWPERAVKQIPCLNTRPCAVLLPLIEKDGERHVVFEVRSSKLRWQPGDICFPGGGIEPGDGSALAAALRETKEELGVDSSHIHVLGPLDYVESPVGVTVYPYAAYVDTTDFTINEEEIDHIFTVPLQWFDEHEPEIATMETATRPGPDFPRDMAAARQSGWKRRTTYQVRIYRYGAYKIWGITACILDNFRGIRAIMEM